MCYLYSKLVVENLNRFIVLGCISYVLGCTLYAPDALGCTLYAPDAVGCTLYALDAVGCTWKHRMHLYVPYAIV